MRLYFVCLCLLIVGTHAPAQTNPVPLDQNHFPRSLSPHSRYSKLRGVRKFEAAPDIDFGSVVTYDPGGTGSDSVAIADVNGDGNPDLIVANSGTSTIGVLLGNGDGTFRPAVTYSAGGPAGALVVADVNGDGKPDVIVENKCISGTCSLGPGSVGVLLGNGDGTFQPVVSYSTGGYGSNLDPSAIAVADVNGDGNPDLIVADTCTAGNQNGCTNPAGVVAVLLNNGDGTFRSPVFYDTGGYYAVAVAVADVNGDGKPDLLVANGSAKNTYPTDGSVGVLLGNGDGTFQTAVAYGSGGPNATSVAAADVNGDGRLDLLVTNAGSCPDTHTCLDGSIGVLLGKGDGTFQTASTFDSGGDFTYSLVVADLYRDGTLDLIVANECPGATMEGGLCNEGAAAVLIGNGNATFQPAMTFASGGYYSYQVAEADLNKDGKPDLVAVSNCNFDACINGPEGVVGVLLNTTPNQPIVVLSPKGLSFPFQAPGVTSAPQAVTVANSGAVALAIKSIAITGTNAGDFAQTNNCGSGLAPNSSCQVKVTFTPTATGSRVAEVQITDNAPGSPQVVPLTGKVQDFTLGVLPPTTLTVTPGQAANYSGFVTSVNGFAQSVNFSCSGQPPQSTCSVKPRSLSLKSGSGSITLVIVTTGSMGGFTQPFGGPPGNHWLAWWAAFGWALGLAWWLGMSRASRAWRPQWLYGVTLLCLLSAVATIAACGGGGGGSSATPPGTYTPKVTATYTNGSVQLSHSVTVTLTVQ